MTILVAVEEDDRQTELPRVAADLASTYGDELIALHVVPTETFLETQQNATSLDKVDAQPIERAESEAAETARSVVEETVDESIDITGVGRVGEPADSIVSTSEDVDARYLVIGGRRRSPVGKAVFGSAAQSILLTADRPVVTVMKE